MKQSSWLFTKSTKTPLELYEEQVQKERKNENKWKMFAYISIGGFVCALCVMVYAINLPRTVPVLVTVSDFGEAKYLGEINRVNYEGIKVPEIAIEYQIRKFVTNKYTIPGDAEVLRENLIDVYACLTGETSSKFSSELKEHNPMSDVKTIRKKVDIESVLKLSKNSYQIDFILNTTNPYNSNVRQSRIRGVITVKMLEPSDDDKIKNPLGIYVSAYDFTELKS